MTSTLLSVCILLCGLHVNSLVNGNPAPLSETESVDAENAACTNQTSCYHDTSLCCVCTSMPNLTSVENNANESINQCPRGTELQNTFLGTDNRSSRMCCRDSQESGGEDEQTYQTENSDVTCYVLIPLMFFIGLFLGMVYCYLIYVKRVSVWPKLRSACCPCLEKKWVLSDITIIENLQEEDNYDRIIPIELVWGPDITEGEQDWGTTEGKQAMDRSEPMKGIGLRGRSRRQSISGDGQQRNRVQSLGRAQNSLSDLATSSGTEQMPTNAMWDSFEEHHGDDDNAPAQHGTVDIYGQEQEGEQRLEVSSENDLEHFLGEVNDLAEQVTVNNTWKDFNFVGTKFAAGLFDCDGGHLELGALGIDLFIPPGALTSDDPELIYLYVSNDEGALLGDSQVSVSSTIYCGPDGLKFQERVVLSYQHCALNAEDSDVKLITLFTNTGVGNQPNFRDLTTDQTCFSFTKDKKCFLFISHFTGFTSVADVGEGRHVRKMMDIMCYTDAFRPRTERLSVRIYCVNQTEDAKRLVMVEESTRRHRKIVFLKQIVIDSRNKDLEFVMKEITRGWKPKPSPHQKIPSGLLLEGQYGSTGYELRKEDTSLSMFECTLEFYQRGNDSVNEVSPQSIHISVEEEQECDSNEEMISRFQLSKMKRVQPLLRFKTRLEIRNKMDPYCALGKDWRLLADAIGLDNNTIRQIEDNFKQGSITSPTLQVLNFWDADKKPASIDHLKDLKEIFQRIERDDVAVIVQNFIEEFERVHDKQCEGASCGC